MENKINISQFLDEKGQVVKLPAKRAAREAALYYIAQKFESGRNYTEKEVNAICEEWHTFRDYFMVRRELVDAGFLRRERDGSRYWVNQNKMEEYDEHTDNAQA